MEDKSLIAVTYEYFEGLGFLDLRPPRGVRWGPRCSSGMDMTLTRVGRHLSPQAGILRGVTFAIHIRQHIRVSGC
ncbi:hypothetical protein CDL15_Pgr015248 [Punica granatum]|uniref:Uncharacterized protein n=1 Tax=Punica granatum TaxID=22663 RepID=A0A218VZU6_PUNGR|nr:hypothetical protein CDL15_Pgr015248 [Punica granatum]